MYHPVEIRIAQDHGHGQFKHLPMEMEFAPGETLLSVSPPEKEIVWQIYVVTYGELTPSPPTSDFWFVHWQVGVKKHTVPLLHSVTDFPYPMWAPCTQSNPHWLEAHNETGATQTIDAQFYLVTFDRNEEWARWMSDLILLGYRFGVGDEILKAVGLGRSEFGEILVDREDYLVKQYGLVGKLGTSERLKILVESVQELIDLIKRLPELVREAPEVPEVPQEEAFEALQKMPDPDNVKDPSNG